MAGTPRRPGKPPFTRHLRALDLDDVAALEGSLRAEELNGCFEDEGFGGLDICDPEDTLTSGDW